MVQLGGGPASNITLTTLEEKLLSLMGCAAVHGDKSVAERGLKRKMNEPVEGEKQNIGPRAARIECIEERCIEDPEDQSVEVIGQHETNQEAAENVIIEEIILDHDYHEYATNIDPTLTNCFQKEK